MSSASSIPQLRPELSRIPDRMKSLPVDRGYPVPWFVQYVDGKPDFRVMDRDKWYQAVNKRLCWVCGDRLGRHLVFALGPMCGVNRVTNEPPCHQECARWSARNCPFLSRPHAERRESGLPENYTTAGTMIDRNPGVTMLWTTPDFKTFTAGQHHLIRVGLPESVEWYAQGRAATRAEVEESVDSGLPLLLKETESMEVKVARDARAGMMENLEKLRLLYPIS